MRRLRITILGILILCVVMPQLVSAAPGQRAATAFAQLRILATGNNGNIYLMDGNGKVLRQLTTRASQTLAYPWYSWSPDQRYALLARLSNDASQDAMLLLDGTGSLRSTLFAHEKLFPSSAGTFGFDTLYPAWADDADVIAYPASNIESKKNQLGPGTSKVTLNVAGVDGSFRGRLLTYVYPLAPGCGGGGMTVEAAREVEWWGHDAGYVQWTLHGRLVVTQGTTCGFPDNIPTGLVDRVTGRALAYWHPSTANFVKHVELAPSGSLYAVEHAAVQTGQPYLITIYNDQGQKIGSELGAGPAWSPNSRYLYYASCQSGRCAINAIDFRNKKQGRISPWESAYAFGPLQIAPDSSTLFFSRIEAVGSNQARVTIQRFDGTGFTTISSSASRPVI